MMDEKNLEDRNLDCECEREGKKKEQALLSAFCHAAAAGDTAMVENLVKAGVDVRNCFDALEHADGKGHMETLKLILPKYDGHLWAWQIDKVLVAAVQSHNLDAVRLILDWVDGKNVATTSPQPPQPPQPQRPVS